MAFEFCKHTPSMVISKHGPVRFRKGLLGQVKMVSERGGNTCSKTFCCKKKKHNAKMFHNVYKIYDPRGQLPSASFFFLVQTKLSWRTLLIICTRDNASESRVRAVWCYDDPTNDCGSCPRGQPPSASCSTIPRPIPLPLPLPTVRPYPMTPWHPLAMARAAAEA